MKITVSQLRKIIKEEVRKSLSEVGEAALDYNNERQIIPLMGQIERLPIVWADTDEKYIGQTVRDTPKGRIVQSFLDKLVNLAGPKLSPEKEAAHIAVQEMLDLEIENAFPSGGSRVPRVNGFEMYQKAALGALRKAYLPKNMQSRYRDS